MIKILVVMSLLCAFLAGLLWWQIGKTAEAESALAFAIDANTNLSKSLELKEQSCDITDKLLRDLQAQNNDIEDKKNTDIDKLNKIPSTKPVKTSSTKVQTNESNVADIDDTLPSSLIDILLKAVNDTDSGGVDSNSR